MSFDSDIKTAKGLITNKEYEKAFISYKNLIDTYPQEESIQETYKKLKKIIDIQKDITKNQNDYQYYKSLQNALKIVLNATYGAFANEYFILSNSVIANSITAQGRDVIKYMVRKIEKYFYTIWHHDTEIHNLLGMEYIAVKDEKYYFLNKKYEPTDKPYPDFNTGILGDILLSRGITTKKLEKYEDSQNGFDIKYKYIIHDFSNIKPLDENPIFKYDDDDEINAYKGNNPICIYSDTDSLYLSYKPIIDSVNYKSNELEFILHMDKVFIKQLFNSYLEEYAKNFKVKNIHDFEIENINKSSLHMGKKMYIKNTVWEDGIFHTDMRNFSTTGMKIIRSSTPTFVRGKNQEGGIWKFIRYIFSTDKPNMNEILKIVRELRDEFDMQNIEDISMTTSCSNYSSHIIDDINGVEVVKGSNFSIKTAAFHNYLLNKNSEYKTKYDIIRGGKIKYYYCKHQVSNTFGYLRGFHPDEIVEKEKVIFDYDTQFEKTVLSIVNDFLKPMNLPLISKRISILGSLFSFKM